MIWEKLKPDGDAADAIGTGELNVDETSVVARAEDATNEVATAAEEAEAEAAPSVNEQDNSTMAQVMKLPL